MCATTEEEKIEMKNIPYRQAIGSLLFLTMITRPDISFSVNVLSRYCENPGKEHWSGVKRIFRYLKGTTEYGITYGRNSEKLIGFPDADWGSDIDERKSITGYIFTLYGGAITWCCKKQPTVALSTTEAEYMAVTACIQEHKWVKSFIDEIYPNLLSRSKLYCDNKGTLCILKNNAHSSRTKHIDIKYRYICECIEKEEFELDYLSTNEMVADILTKATSALKIQTHLTSMGINNPVF